MNRCECAIAQFAEQDVSQFAVQMCNTGGREGFAAQASSAGQEARGRVQCRQAVGGSVVVCPCSGTGQEARSRA